MNPRHFEEAVLSLRSEPKADSSGDIRADVDAIADTLSAFRVDAEVTGASRGPVITRYEVTPSRGVSVKRIVALEKDICRQMAATTIRIEAPVPGTNFVGVEVPNKTREVVRLSEIALEPEFTEATSKLTFTLGKDIAGKPLVADLAKMPHLLVAGATNSGKSVFLNSLITSIALRSTPDEVQFCLIDPKRVELTQFATLPHLWSPIITETNDAMRALRAVTDEMDNRYKAFGAKGVRNLAAHNEKFSDEALPYIVVVIDELADLMMTSSGEAEEKLCRLAQLARATGIHLVVATQRPSVNVVTGTIKANFPSRIAFALPSHHDSRTILDDKGAEKLIGNGDMLYMPQGAAPIRVQGVLIEDDEIDTVVLHAAAYYPRQTYPIDALRYAGFTF